MIDNWKRGTLVGIASATILTTGGGAALAAGSAGSSPASARASARVTAVAPSCVLLTAPPRGFAPPRGVTTAPGGKGSAGVKAPFGVRTWIRSSAALGKTTAAVPAKEVAGAKGVAVAKGSCPVPGGPICGVIFSTATPLHLVRPMKATPGQKFIPGQKVIAIMHNPGGAKAPIAIACKAGKPVTCLPAVAKQAKPGASAHLPARIVIRCAPPVAKKP